MSFMDINVIDKTIHFYKAFLFINLLHRFTREKHKSSTVINIFILTTCTKEK